MRVCMHVHVCGQYDKFWTAIAISFNAYWVALPTGEGHRLDSATEALSQDKGRGGRSVTGVHGSVTGEKNKSVTEGMEIQQVGTLTGAWLHVLLQCTCILGHGKVITKIKNKEKRNVLSMYC